jgi:hypothetical protein
VLAAAALVAGLSGVAPDDVARAVRLTTLPLWFLVVYLGVVVLAPAMFRLHERAGLAVPLLLLVPVAAGDALRLATGQEAWAYGSFVAGWLAIHQLGFVWHDGGPTRRPWLPAALAAGGVGALVLLTVPGPYPVSMVTVPGATMQNPSPPSLALVALAVAQLGLAALVGGPAERWLRGPRPWRAVLAVNTVVLTIFLWHLVAALLGALLLDAVGLLPPSDVRTGAWWLGRVPWVAALAALLTVLVGLFGRVERRAMRTRRPRATAVAGVSTSSTADWRPAAGGVVAGGYLAVVGGLLWLAVAGEGPHGPFAVPTGALLLYLAGAGALRFCRARR